MTTDRTDIIRRLTYQEITHVMDSSVPFTWEELEGLIGWADCLLDDVLDYIYMSKED